MTDDDVLCVRSEHYREKSTSSRSSSSSRATHELALDLRTGGLAGVAKRLKCLATNGPLVLIVLYGTSDAVIINRTASFGAKFVQLQFGLTTSMAGIAFGQSFSEGRPFQPLNKRIIPGGPIKRRQRVFFDLLKNSVDNFDDY